jgi:hypothetical protein
MELMRPLLVRTPEIINGELPGQGWSEMGELVVPESNS